jgi:hypothetical protein
MKRLILGASLLTALTPSLVVFPSTAFAQTGTSVIQGNVSDAATKGPAADAVITVTSPAVQGEQVVVTDSSGFYRVPNLPPGTYTVRVEKDKYRPFERAAVQLRSDIALRVNIDLLPETVTGEEVSVVGRPPTIDVGSSSVSTTIDENLTRRVPIARPGGKGAGVRSFESLAQAAPEAKGDTYGTSVAGTTSPENRYLVDGLAVNNTAYGIGGTPLSAEFIKEVNIVTGGYLPEFGRATGGILNVVTKSGSNEIRGSAWSYATPGFLEGTGKFALQEGVAVATHPPTIDLVADVGADVGFPIVRDKLWLYTGVQASRQAYEVRRSFHQTQLEPVIDPATGMPMLRPDGTPVERARLDASMRPVRQEIDTGLQTEFPAIGNSVQAVAKLSWAPSTNHAVSVTGIAAPSWSGGGLGIGSGAFGVDPRTGVAQIDPANNNFLNGEYVSLARRYTNHAYDALAKWTASSSGKRAVVETTFGWHHETNDNLPSDGTRPGSGQGLAGISGVIFRRTRPTVHNLADFEMVPPGLCDGPNGALRCPITNYTTTSVGQINEVALDRYQLKSTLTMLGQALGHHVVKVGGDLEMMQYGLLKAYAGGNWYREATDGTNGPVYADYRNYGYLIGPDQPVFLDKMESETSTIGLGAFVQDSWSVLDKITVNLGLRYDGQYIYNSNGDLGMALPNQVAPRAGFIWDPTQTGQTKIFGSYARYYQFVPLDMADRALSGDPQIQSQHSSPPCDPRDPAQQKVGCQSDAGRVAIGDPSDPNQRWAVTGGGATPVDPDLKPQSSDEIVLGAEYQVLRDSRLGLSYTRRWMNNVIEDMSRDEATTYFIGNPGRGMALGFPEAKRNYDAFTLFFSRSFFESWLAQASYTLSWLRGNYSGLFRPESGQLDPNINSDFDLQSLLPNREGPLPGDRRHQIKVFGARDFTLGRLHHLLAGIGLRANSGDPTNLLGSHIIYGAREVYVLPRGSGERLPWNFSADVQVGYSLALSDKSTLSATIDVWNLLNFQAATNRDELYTRVDVLPVDPSGDRAAALGRITRSNGTAFLPADKNPNFGNPTAYQPPRIVRFGLRLTY